MIKLRMTIGMMLAVILIVAIGMIAVASTNSMNSIIKDSTTPYQTQPKDCRYNPKDC